LIVNLIKYSQLTSVEFWNLFALLLLFILAMNNIKQRKILGNLRQLVGRVDVNRAVKSTRRKNLPLGLLRLVTINCRCIPEDNNEAEQVLEKRWETFLGLVFWRRKDEQLAYKSKKITKYMLDFKSWIYSFGMQYW